MEKSSGVITFEDVETLEKSSAKKVAQREKYKPLKKAQKEKRKGKHEERKSYDSEDEEAAVHPVDEAKERGDEDDDLVDLDDVGEDEDHGADAKVPVSRGGMADAFSRILSQRLPEACADAPVLAKRKTKQMKEAEAERAEVKRLRLERIARRKVKEVGMHTPDHRDIEYERSLRRVATRGVVALFNAIAQHQHTSAAEEGSAAAGLQPAKTARDIKQLSKDNFLQMLKAPKGGAAAGSGASAEAQPVSSAAGSGGSTATKGASAWLRDDFMTMGRGKSIKDWDRHEEQGDSDDDEDEGGDGGDESD